MSATWWLVEGEVGEVYAVQAETEQDGTAKWSDGILELQKSNSVEPVNARATGS